MRRQGKGNAGFSSITSPIYAADLCGLHYAGLKSMAPSTKLRANHRGKVAQKRDDPIFERAKNLATIVSAIAIPIVLAIAGYFVQRELSNEGLKKDYVGIAASILKEDAAKQEPELRTWAVKVLDDNSPVPFSKRAKEGLIAGSPVVVPGPAWIGPPEKCRKPPAKRTVYEALSKLSKEAKELDQRQLLLRMQDFVDVVLKQEQAALETAARLECLQKWVVVEEKMDIEYRERIGALSSKSVYEQLAQEKAAASSSAKVLKSASAPQSPSVKASDRKTVQ